MAARLLLVTTADWEIGSVRIEKKVRTTLFGPSADEGASLCERFAPFDGISVKPGWLYWSSSTAAFFSVYARTALFIKAFIELCRFAAMRFSFACNDAGSLTEVAARSWRSELISSSGMVDRSTVFRIKTMSWRSSPRREMCSRSLASTLAIKRVLNRTALSGILDRHFHQAYRLPSVDVGDPRCCCVCAACDSIPEQPGLEVYLLSC